MAGLKFKFRSWLTQCAKIDLCMCEEVWSNKKCFVHQKARTSTNQRQRKRANNGRSCYWPRAKISGSIDGDRRFRRSSAAIVSQWYQKPLHSTVWRLVVRVCSSGVIVWCDRHWPDYIDDISIWYISIEHTVDLYRAHLYWYLHWYLHIPIEVLSQCWPQTPDLELINCIIL